MPTSTVCFGEDRRALAGEMRELRRLAIRAAPRAACRARCRIRSVAGLFMSPCASTQISPSGLPACAACARRRRDRSRAEAVIAAERDRQRAFRERRRATVWYKLLADARDLLDVSLARIARALASRESATARRPCRRPCRPSCGELIAESGNAKRRRPHVGAAPVAAEVQRHADDVNGLMWRMLSAFSVGHRNALVPRRHGGR